MSLDEGPDAVSARLKRVSDLCDLRVEHRLDAKIDYGPDAVDRRLREASRLRRLCLDLGAPALGLS